MKDSFVQILGEIAFGGSIACFGAVVDFLLKLKEGEKMDWKAFFIRMLTASFCGFVCLELLQVFHASANLEGAVCGIAGYSGAECLDVIKDSIKELVRNRGFKK